MNVITGEKSFINYYLLFINRKKQSNKFDKAI